MKHKLLVVDDERMIADSICRVSQKDFAASAAYSGTEAIKKISDGNFDIVLCDFLMSDLSGEEVLSWVVANHAKVKVVMMTAYGENSIHEQLMEKGASLVLSKPFEDIFLIPKILKDLLG